MPGRPQISAPTALEYFDSLVAADVSLPLTEAAVAIAQDADPGLDIEAVLADIDALAVRLKRRLPADAVPLQRLRLLNRFFFQELGFAGNVNNYYDPSNSFLPEVLRSRRGIPISLAVLYIELATQAGLTACGVSFPGHFLVKVRLPSGEVVTDPLTGHSLSLDELDELLAPYRRRLGLEGDFDVPLGLFLQAASPREVLARMLRNLKEIYRSTDDLIGLLAVQQRLVALFPQSWEERRDRGLVRKRLGRHADATADLISYLENAPDADDAAAIAEELARMRDGRVDPGHGYGTR